MITSSITALLAFLLPAPAKTVEVAPHNDPFTIDSLIAWLRTKSGEYKYTAPSECLFANYAHDMGFPGQESWHSSDGRPLTKYASMKNMFKAWNAAKGTEFRVKSGVDLPFGNVANGHRAGNISDQTYEHALERALIWKASHA